MNDREQTEIRTAIRRAAALESNGRKLGDRLIAAGREVVDEWHKRKNSQRRLDLAIERLERLVGKP